jgi:hypothetical protein
MMPTDPHALMVMATVALAAWMMTRAGLAKNALEHRRKRRLCPSCGRYDDCVCK